MNASIGDDVPMNVKEGGSDEGIVHRGEWAV